jgi:hypothetical protein
MSGKLAIVVGFVGKLPYAGMALYNLHHILGLQDLGYDVHYVERQNTPDDCYDPVADVMTDDYSYALAHLRRELVRVGLGPEHFSFIDRTNGCHGAGWSKLRDLLGRADFVLTLATPTWFDELERCPNRAFVDGDPLFTQAAMLHGHEPTDRAPDHYTVLFTYAVRIGKPDCMVPDAQRRWIPTRPAVATRLWKARPPERDGLPITCLMHWSAGPDVVCEGRIYGHKNREFEQFIDLPRRSQRTFALAVGGGAPKQQLESHGWNLCDPLVATRTIEAYREFISGSRADFGVAKHAYVASRCGWFSDRSICYLASGRPVLHQDTGFADWLPVGEGVLAFSNMSEATEALECLDADYGRHAGAARAIAEEYFEASTVIGRMLDDAGFG